MTVELLGRPSFNFLVLSLLHRRNRGQDKGGLGRVMLDFI